MRFFNKLVFKSEDFKSYNEITSYVDGIVELSQEIYDEWAAANIDPITNDFRAELIKENEELREELASLRAKLEIK